jgi:hypothetical protein
MRKNNLPTGSFKFRMGKIFWRLKALFSFLSAADWFRLKPSGFALAIRHHWSNQN